MSQISAISPTGLRPSFVKSLQRIVLIGFMGAGKTTCGLALAQQLGWTFYDADQQIEHTTGLSIADIFSRHGEPHFRDVEREIIQSLLSTSHSVLSLGGGAVETEETLANLHSPGTLSVFLQVDLADSLLRCEPDGITVFDRPVLADKAVLAQRYARRDPLYRQAHLTITTGNRNPEQVVEQILDSIRKDYSLAKTL